MDGKKMKKIAVLCSYSVSPNCKTGVLGLNKPSLTQCVSSCGSLHLYVWNGQGSSFSFLQENGTQVSQPLRS